MNRYCVQCGEWIGCRSYGSLSPFRKSYRDFNAKRFCSKDCKQTFFQVFFPTSQLSKKDLKSKDGVKTK